METRVSLDNPVSYFRLHVMVLEINLIFLIKPSFLYDQKVMTKT